MLRKATMLENASEQEILLEVRRLKRLEMTTNIFIKTSQELMRIFTKVKEMTEEKLS